MPIWSPEASITKEALEALEVARRRYSTDEGFESSLASLQTAIDEGKAVRIGNRCLLGTGYGYGRNEKAIAATIRSNPSRFIAVLVDKTVATLSSTATVINSALIESSVMNEATVLNSTLEESSVRGTALVEDSTLYGTAIHRGNVSGAYINSTSG